MPSTIKPYVKPQIKNPAEDPLIAMQHERRTKELRNKATARLYSDVSGGVVKKSLTLQKLEGEIREMQASYKEFEEMTKLLQKDRDLLAKRNAEHVEWCETFDQHIGPFEAKYEECKEMVKASYDFAKLKYKASVQKLIDDFGYHPTFKRWFDEI